MVIGTFFISNNCCNNVYCRFSFISYFIYGNARFIWQGLPYRTAGSTNKDRPEATALHRSQPADFAGIIERSCSSEWLNHRAPPWLCSKKCSLSGGTLHVFRLPVHLFHHPEGLRSHHSIRFGNCLVAFRVPNFKPV